MSLCQRSLRVLPLLLLLYTVTSLRPRKCGNQTAPLLLGRRKAIRKIVLRTIAPHFPSRKSFGRQESTTCMASAPFLLCVKIKPKLKTSQERPFVTCRSILTSEESRNVRLFVFGCWATMQCSLFQPLQFLSYYNPRLHQIHTLPTRCSN